MSFNHNPYSVVSVLVSSPKDAVVPVLASKILSSDAVVMVVVPEQHHGDFEDHRTVAAASSSTSHPHAVVTNMNLHLRNTVGELVWVQFERFEFSSMVATAHRWLHGERRMSLFVGQAPLEILRDGGKRISLLINWVAGYNIVTGDIDLHENSSNSSAQTTGKSQVARHGRSAAPAASSAAHHHNHTGCATITVTTTPMVAERVMRVINEKAYVVDESSVWLADRDDVEKRGQIELIQRFASPHKPIRAQRLVLQFSRKQRKQQ